MKALLTEELMVNPMSNHKKLEIAMEEVARLLDLPDKDGTSEGWGDGYLEGSLEGNSEGYSEGSVEGLPDGRTDFLTDEET